MSPRIAERMAREERERERSPVQDASEAPDRDRSPAPGRAQHQQLVGLQGPQFHYQGMILTMPLTCSAAQPVSWEASVQVFGLSTSCLPCCFNPIGLLSLCSQAPGESTFMLRLGMLQ